MPPLPDKITNPQTSTDRPSFLQVQSIFFFVLTVLAGIWILLPFIDFQPYLSQGDHGRDLYAFEQTLHGARPYRDYWWVYGPVMPIYYSWFFLWLGKSIPGILTGKMFLDLVSGIFVYLSLGCFFSPFSAFTAAVWFWVFNADFFFTYNHAGGITMLLAAAYCLLSYLKNSRIRSLSGGLFCLFILSLIKVNIGIANLFVFMASFHLIDLIYKNPYTAKKRCIDFLSVLLVLCVIVIYRVLLNGLAVYEIRQCLPYLGGDQPYEVPIFEAAKILGNSIWRNMLSNRSDGIFAVIVILSVISTIVVVIRHWKEKKLRDQRLLMIFILGFFLLVNLHEFLMSGVFYRSFWAKPFSIMLIFTLIAIAVSKFPGIIQNLLYTGILWIAFQQGTTQIHLINQFKTADHYLAHPKAKIFVGNTPQWITTVNQTTNYLSTQLKPDETFFALPYDCIYYYLTGKKSPTRQLIFFDHIKIPPEQERKIIRELEARSVRYVVLSSRFASPEQGLGVFGQTYCPILGKYLADNFQVAATFGDWQNIPGWAWNHGTKILKRTTNEQKNHQ